MAEQTYAELARVVAELGELVARLTDDGDARRLVARARALTGRLQPDEPARWALREQTVTVEIDVPARVVAETLANERTGAVVVVASGRPVGVVAERDVVAAVAAERPLLELTAADLVSPAMVTARPTDSIGHVAALMATNRVRHVPLVDADGIVGVLSALDVARAVAAGDG